MIAEDIVRKLAECDPTDLMGYCTLCRVHVVTELHVPGCPWRLAVEHTGSE